MVDARPRNDASAQAHRTDGVNAVVDCWGMTVGDTGSLGNNLRLSKRTGQLG